MPGNAKLYIALVSALGLGVIANSFAAAWTPYDAARFAAYIALACIVSTWKVRLPGMQGTMSVNFLFVLLGVAELSLQETLVLGLMATIVQCFWKSKRRSPLQLVFNVSAMALSIYGCYQLPRVFTDAPHQPAFLALAACVFFLINTASVSMVLSLIGGKRFTDVWVNCHLWTFPYYLAGAATAAVISAASRTVGWKPALLPLMLMYLIYTYYRLYLTQHANETVAGATS
jgi:hypothetical protein